MRSLQKHHRKYLGPQRRAHDFEAVAETLYFPIVLPSKQHSEDGEPHESKGSPTDADGTADLKIQRFHHEISTHEVVPSRLRLTTCRLRLRLTILILHFNLNFPLKPAPEELEQLKRASSDPASENRDKFQLQNSVRSYSVHNAHAHKGNTYSLATAYSRIEIDNVEIMFHRFRKLMLFLVSVLRILRAS